MRADGLATSASGTSAATQAPAASTPRWRSNETMREVMRPEIAWVAREASPCGARGMAAVAVAAVESASMLRTFWLFLLTWLDTLRSRSRSGPLRPGWPFSFEWIVRYLRADWDATATWEPARLRAHVDGRPTPRSMQRRVAVQDGEQGGVPSRSFTPAGAGRGVLLFFHGGSYAYGSARTSHAELLAQLAHESGRTVIGVDYRLAPEHVYPAQLQDARASFAALRASGLLASQIVVGGDSAGGNLALMLQLALRDAGEQAAAAVLLSPWSDLSMPGASFERNAAYDYGTRELLVQQAEAFAGGVPLDDPRLSPVHADVRGLAPVLIVTGSAEIPHDDILRLADHLRAAEVDTTLHVANEMPHNPAVFANYHPEATRALAAMARFVRAHLP